MNPSPFLMPPIDTTTILQLDIWAGRQFRSYPTQTTKENTSIFTISTWISTCSTQKNKSDQQPVGSLVQPSRTSREQWRKKMSNGLSTVLMTQLFWTWSQLWTWPTLPVFMKPIRKETNSITKLALLLIRDLLPVSSLKPGKIPALNKLPLWSDTKENLEKFPSATTNLSASCPP